MLPRFPHGTGLSPWPVWESTTATNTKDSVASAIAAALGLKLLRSEPPNSSSSTAASSVPLLDNFEPLPAAAGLLLNLLTHRTPGWPCWPRRRTPQNSGRAHFLRLEGLLLRGRGLGNGRFTPTSLQLTAEQAEQATRRNLLSPAKPAANGGPLPRTIRQPAAGH
ncbi:MAG: hypothetical protein H6656_10265 [Ardenticatenaceae bacterium]|nr:hypothetical protein [Ardenticatenaceae bacterium]